MTIAWPFYGVNFQIRAKVIEGIVQRTRKPYDIHTTMTGYPRCMPRSKPALIKPFHGIPVQIFSNWKRKLPF